MSGFTTGMGQTFTNVNRGNLYSTQLKDILEDQLIALPFVRMLTDFPDGDTWNIPSIGQMEAANYAEDEPVRYTSFDTGNFTFQITDYKQSGTYISEKFRQDSYWAPQIESQFVPKMARAIGKVMETNILSLGPNGQTPNDSNTINGGKHRMVATGTNKTLSVQDFANARYALEKANVPMTNLIAIVDPSVEAALATQPNLINFINPTPAWADVITNGLGDGMRFTKNIMGFDVYVSQNLKTGISETIDTVSVTNGAANLFFSAAGGDLNPFIGSMRQAPKVDIEYNKDRQRTEYVTTCRYGFALYRPENMFVAISDNSQVYA